MSADTTSARDLGMWAFRMRWDDAERAFKVQMWEPSHNGIAGEHDADGNRIVRQPDLVARVSRSDAQRALRNVHRFLSAGARPTKFEATEREMRRLAAERSAAIELVAATRGCTVGEALQVVVAMVEAQR